MSFLVVIAAKRLQEFSEPRWCDKGEGLGT